MPEKTFGNEVLDSPQAPKHWLRETIELLLLAVLVVVPIRFFIANPFIVSGSSMIPTFKNGEYLIVDQLSYRFSEPERGDVIVFHYPKDPSKFFIKRIIGLPGETLEIKRGEVTIVKNGVGEALDESYIKNKSSDNGLYTLSTAEYFVMGDNRISSSDSRVWGPLPEELVSGRVLVRLFPPQRLSLFPGKIN